MRQDVPYPQIKDARVDYPYAAVLVKATEKYSLPASWTFARALDSGEVEVLYDGAGTTGIIPAGSVELRPPPEEHLQENSDSAKAWDQFLQEN